MRVCVYVCPLSPLVPACVCAGMCVCVCACVCVHGCMSSACAAGWLPGVRTEPLEKPVGGWMQAALGSFLGQSCSRPRPCWAGRGEKESGVRRSLLLSWLHLLLLVSLRGVGGEEPRKPGQP